MTEKTRMLLPHSLPHVLILIQDPWLRAAAAGVDTAMRGVHTLHTQATATSQLTAHTQEQTE